MIKSCYTNRIKKISEFVNKNIIAEIGADHGYITKYLFLKNKIKFAYLTDISEKSLNKAIVNLSKQYSNKTVFLVGDGLNVFRKEVKKMPKQIIIAGMGGKEIAKIMAKNTCFKNFILQPQKNVLELRKFLNQNNYKILKDEVVKDGKMYYFVLKVKKIFMQQKLCLEKLMFGLTNLKKFSEDFLCYLKFEHEKNEKILQKKYVKEIYEYQMMIEKMLNRKEKTNVWKIIRVSKVRRGNIVA